MCSRYYADASTEEKVRHLTGDPGCRIRGGDIHPSEFATLLTGGGDGLKAEEMKWGFPGRDGQGIVINARAETITELRTFRDSVLFRRCVIPAKGFYEWNSEKEKYQFEKPGQTLFMAGCFDAQCRFVVITTAANESVLPIHARMPLLLSEGDMKRWIANTESIYAMLQQTPQALHRWTQYHQMTLFDGNRVERS